MNEYEESLLGRKKGTKYYVTREEWDKLRPLLVAKMQRLIPGLRAEMTAYTPGETLKLMQSDTVQLWFERMKSFKVTCDGPIIFVPCAKTKPWLNAPRGVYKGYNELKARRPDWNFVTVSEPLGIVPYEHWGDFPLYDCPGLFRGQRQVPMEPWEWRDYGFPEERLIPHDPQAVDLACRILGTVIGQFAVRHRHPKFAFVDAFGAQMSTHSKMIVAAEMAFGVRIPRFPRREQPRTSPAEFIEKVVCERLGIN